MDRPVRIAVVGQVDPGLIGDLRQLPLRPEVRPLVSVVADTEALMRLQPDLLLVQFGTHAAEEVGAVRLLQRLWPGLAVAVVTDAADEVSTGQLAARIPAQVIVYPDAPGQLAGAIEQLMHGGDRPRPEVFVDLAHGLSDEINNPLMFVSGHLQLLRAQLDREEDANRRAQVDAALTGLGRIQAAVERLRLVSDAAGGPRDRSDVDLLELVSRAVDARPAAASCAGSPATSWRRPWTRSSSSPTRSRRWPRAAAWTSPRPTTPAACGYWRAARSSRTGSCRTPSSPSTRSA
jgi:signal transduction histidine kinase